MPRNSGIVAGVADERAGVRALVEGTGRDEAAGRLHPPHQVVVTGVRRRDESNDVVRKRDWTATAQRQRVRPASETFP